MARAKRVREAAEYGGMVRRMLRAYGRRVADRDVEALTELVGMRAELEAAVQVAVDGLRASGYSWAEVARPLGISRQAAQQRYGR
jgi:hypothetical protein